MVLEVEDLRLQFLEVPDPNNIDSRTIAETLIRFHTKYTEDDNVFHTSEPEIIIDTKGRERVPRLQPIPAANDRYNSVQRHITHPTDVSMSGVELEKHSNGYTIRQTSRYETSSEITEPETIEIRTTHTVLSAIKTAIGHKFLALGVDSRGTRYLTLASSLTSVANVPEKSAVACDLYGLLEASFLTIMAAHLVSMAVIDPLFAGQTLVVHNASDVIARAITAQTSSNDIKVVYTTDSTDQRSIPSSWIQLSPYLGPSSLSQIIPADVACFVGLSDEESENELSILSNLSPHCRKENTRTLYSSDGVKSGSCPPDMMSHILGRATDFARDFSSQAPNQSAETLSLESLAVGEGPKDPLTVIDWTASTSVPVRVTRFDIKPFLKNDKTYWLCGVSGTLGLSLCDWMIDRGVRNPVPTSRNPKAEIAWIEHHRCNGVNVKVLPWYVYI